MRALIDKCQSYDSYCKDLKTDLIVVYSEFMIANQDKLKIDLQFYEMEQEWEFGECGTYRMRCGMVWLFNWA